MSKRQPSQKEGVKHRDTVRMHHYNCKSKLNIAYRTNTSGEKTYVITISLKHHLKHTPYYDISLHPDATALIHENLDWFSPHKVSKKVLAIYLSITVNQVHSAWTTMSETLWKCDSKQLPSVKKLLGELKDNIAVLSLPGIDRVEQVAWVMTKIVLQLQGKIVKIGIDTTCENSSDHQK